MLGTSEGLVRAVGRLRGWQLTRDGGWALFAASGFVGVSNFGFHMMMSRMLGPRTYGALGALLGLVTVLTVVVGAVQVAVTQVVAERQDRGRLALLCPMRRVGIVAAALATGIGLVSPALQGFLHLRSPVPVILFGLFVGIGVASLVPQGVLLGRLDFHRVAAALLVGTVLRLATGALLVEAGLGLDGAILASVLSGAAALGILIWPLRRELDPAHHGANLEIGVRTLVLPVASVGGFTALTAVAPLLARHFLPALVSGYFVAAATAAQIALFLPGAVGLVAFPRLAALQGSGPEARRLLAQSLGAVGLLGGATALAIAALPHLAIAILFGAHYQPAASALRVLAPAGAADGVVSLLVYFHLARRSPAALLSWAAVAAAAIFMVSLHSGLASLAWIVLGVTVGLLVAMILPALSGAGAGSAAGASSEVLAAGVAMASTDRATSR